MEKCVVLLSGGLDSATTLAIAKGQGLVCYCLTVDYGQRHQVEIESAKKVAEAFGAAEHRLIEISQGAFGGSALTDGIGVPKNRSENQMGSEIPVTYVPARNTVMLALALAYAESIGVLDIFIGVNSVDYSGYPDCRPEYIEAFERLAVLATKIGVEGSAIRIHAPLIDLTKPEIIRLGLRLGVDYALTHSCYDPDLGGHACGQCDSCLIRKKAFDELGMVDPALAHFHHV